MLGRVILLFVLIIINGFFSCAEIAVIQIGEGKLKKLSEEGNQKAKRLLKFKEDPSRFLSTIQVAITLAGFLSSAFASESFAGMVDQLVRRFFPALSLDVIHPISIVLITILLSYLSIVFGELVPKRLAQVYTEPIALFITPVLGLVSILSTPLVFLLSASTNSILRLIGINPDEDSNQISEEDILMMVDEGMEKGTIESTENEFIQNVFEFKDLTVEEVCTHRTDVAMLYIEDTDRQWRRTIHEHRFACYPICGEDDDDIIGILNTKDYFRLNDLSRPNVMKNAVDRPFFVSQNMKVSDLFDTMKKERKYYAVVLDEYGGMTGIVTLHDLIEALVGDLHEEDELPEPEPIEAIGDNEWIILGSADLEDVNEALKIHLDLEAADTFGGYIMGILGKVPEDGSSFHLDTDNLSIDVAYIKNHRIGKTVVRLLTPPEKEEEEE
ncbi:MAG: HlyC/CorC family transporter [Lachnospiraceae bacterium]|jgi:Hemolysins and related proteins containing CBS domains|nr:HlyC/CorC family transporter [Lachnospiraceae bacterium]